MIFRYMFFGYCRSKLFAIKNLTDVLNLSVAVFANKIFVYLESERENVSLDDIVEADLIPFPNDEKWIRMMEVFHYSKPIDKKHWARKIKKKEAYLRINFLHENMVSSYIYYHFQYQESGACNGNKYGVIFIYGNMLIMYSEKPMEIDTVRHDCLINERTKVENWGELMSKHFMPWIDYDGDWREIELLYSQMNTNKEIFHGKK